MAEVQTYDLSITGVSYELAVAAGLPEDPAELEAKKRGRGWTYTTGITKFDADTITYLTDAAANINYLSTPRTGRQRLTSSARMQRRSAPPCSISRKSAITRNPTSLVNPREALEAAMDWMVSEDEDDEDDDGAEIWERVLIPARDAYRASRRKPITEEHDE